MLPDTLPAGLTELVCSCNQLLLLPETLPAGLRALWCYNTQLTTLPDTLPAGLTELVCSYTQLLLLPETLPAGLRTLWCDNTQLTTLPDTLPAALTTLYCHTNNFPDYDYEEPIPVYVARVNAIAEAASKGRIVQRCALVFEEMAQKVWHPSRVERLMLAGVDMEDM
jgi:hypothetical protein